MTSQRNFRIRLGMLCLLASGILTVIGLYLRGPIIDPVTETEAYVHGAVASSHYYAWGLLLPSLVIQCFAWLALYAFVANTAVDRIAFWGMVLSIAGNGLFLPSVGIIAFASPIVGQLYLGGNTEVIQIATGGLFGTFPLIFLSGSGVVLFAGSILISILLWRAPSLPTWTAIPYLLHAVFLTFVAPYAYPLELTGGVLLLITSIAITHAVWRQTT